MLLHGHEELVCVHTSNVLLGKRLPGQGRLSSTTSDGSARLQRGRAERRMANLSINGLQLRPLARQGEHIQTQFTLFVMVSDFDKILFSFLLS